MKKYLIMPLLSIALVWCWTTTLYGYEIIAFGDSITFGSGSDTGGYPPKLAALLAAKGATSTVYNYGEKGETTAYGSGRIETPLAAIPGATYILILEGTNDIFSGMSIGSTQYHLETMVYKSRNYGVTPILSTLTPDTRDSASQKDISGTYNPMIWTIGSNLGVAVVDNYSAVAGSWSGLSDDEIHPNDAGYQVMAQVWSNAIPASGGDSGSSDGDSGGGGGCFIATAAFGSLLEPHVVLLQQFRDQYLLTNGPGRQFVKLYYIFSPPVAAFIAKSDILKSVTRVLLYPLFLFGYFLVEASVFQQAGMVMGLFLLVAGCIAFVTAGRNRSRHRAVSLH